jgi:hypothetical protein
VCVWRCSCGVFPCHFAGDAGGGLAYKRNSPHGGGSAMQGLRLLAWPPGSWRRKSRSCLTTSQTHLLKSSCSSLSSPLALRSRVLPSRCAICPDRFTLHQDTQWEPATHAVSWIASMPRPICSRAARLTAARTPPLPRRARAPQLTSRACASSSSLASSRASPTPASTASGAAWASPSRAACRCASSSWWV